MKFRPVPTFFRSDLEDEAFRRRSGLRDLDLDLSTLLGDCRRVGRFGGVLLLLTFLRLLELCRREPPRFGIGSRSFRRS